MDAPTYPPYGFMHGCGLFNHFESDPYDSNVNSSGKWIFQVDANSLIRPESSRILPNITTEEQSGGVTRKQAVVTIWCMILITTICQTFFQ